MNDQDISIKMRDYLAEIYRLQERQHTENGFVSTSELAETLLVTAPAVNRMVTRLKEQNMLIHEPYQGIKLTNEGREQALLKLRSHRIVETFLVKVMGFEWHEVYEEAQQMSANITDALLERMLEMSEHPEFCPHGEPIPNVDGQVMDLGDELLINADIHKDYVITRVLTREPDRLAYMEALELVPGSTFELIHAAPFNGPMQLKLKDEYRIIGYNLAELIKVREK